MKRTPLLLLVITSLPAGAFAGSSSVNSAIPGELGQSAAAQDSAPRVKNHEFYFTRAIYTGPPKRGITNGVMQIVPSWAADYPKSDVQLLTILAHLIDLDVPSTPNAIRLDDPDLRRFPFLYAVEVAHMRLPASEAKNLRNYLLSGGFLMVDDFWGTREWAIFQWQMRQVFPDRPIVDVPQDHPIFHMVYDLPEVKQVPNLDNIRRGRTFESDGYIPEVRGIFDDDGRLMVSINWNTDLGDAWEWAESPDYPLKYSTYASEIAVNTIVYAMTH